MKIVTEYGIRELTTIGYYQRKINRAYQFANPTKTEMDINCNGILGLKHGSGFFAVSSEYDFRHFMFVIRIFWKSESKLMPIDQ